MPIFFRKVTVDDAEMLLKWRQDPEITRFLYTDIDHGVSEQREWIKSCDAREDFYHFVMCFDDRPIGYLSFADYDRQNRRCSTGQYVYEQDDRRRYGGLLHTYIMDYGFYKLDCHKIVNSFMAVNERIVKIQEILKYRHVGLYKDHIYKHDRYYDMHVFELLRSEWATHRRLYTRDETKAAFEDWRDE